MDQPRPTPPSLRAATAQDAAALAQLENETFAGDRISLRSWHRLIASDSATVMVARLGGRIAGASVLLCRRRTSVARLYSIAVAAAARGRGVARTLLEAAIKRARATGASVLRLETRHDNHAAQALFAHHGFVQFERRAHYYEDGADALRLQRSLWNIATAPQSAALRTPYYAQTLDFSCGPCALLMAMAALEPGTRIDRTAEIRLWREATTVFMAAGHGGCGPFGLAMAAVRRGFHAQVYAPAGTRLFIGSVRDPRKKEVIELVEADFRAELEATAAPVFSAPVSPERIASHLRQGGVPVVLISLWRLHGEKGPHWVVVTGFDGAVFRILDPIATTAQDDPGISISVDEFSRIARYGRHRQTAAVVLYKQDARA
ncbi:peptidase C39 family protein [Xylophilus sp. ASV27]|uniref:peptidase C39 family protein n=1 Tax=Xylophilus sp. ASV27 TaxID=2795129 RepID=UPI0018EADC49|nr:peptidase C39 family protein [Xylophilus sp. ASV27]